MINRAIIFSVFSLALNMNAPVFAAANDNPLCAAKEADVQRQISTAQKQKNKGQLRGLETALDNIRAHCTDEKVLADAREEVQESLKELDERQQELEEALQEGDTEEIEKRQEKLKEATSELEEHMQELEHWTKKDR